ncbi:Nucleolar complex protein 2-like protein [Frankliniella fusca]|uniref:Nucleolar complex protein 2-like protein n=1 Tax=Frankliniella fusca TaxID=407009 RepID=A0AAE1LV44_9NEOP|nr:Nucleolar complex protein 2-like protein [Frankliniella fusca]
MSDKQLINRTSTLQSSVSGRAGFWTATIKVEKVKSQKAVKVITAPSILRNICIDSGDFVDYDIPPPRRREIEGRDEEDAEAFRHILCLAHNKGRRQAFFERNI